MNPLNVLVLCAGNVGRSPLAEAMIRTGLAGALGMSENELAMQGIVVSSAGTRAPEGHEASSRGIAFARSRGLDLSAHQARSLTPAMVNDADLVLCMDADNVAAVRELVPGADTKTRLVAGEGVEIPDPRHHDDDFFRDVGEQISVAIDHLIPVLLERIGEDGRFSAGSPATPVDPGR